MLSSLCTHARFEGSGLPGGNQFVVLGFSGSIDFPPKKPKKRMSRLYWVNNFLSQIADVPTCHLFVIYAKFIILKKGVLREERVSKELGI